MKLQSEKMGRSPYKSFADVTRPSGRKHHNSGGKKNKFANILKQNAHQSQQSTNIEATASIAFENPTPALQSPPGFHDPKSRSLKKRSIAQVSAEKKIPNSRKNRGGSNKKRGKKKKSPKKAQEVNNEIFDDDEVSMLSAQSFVELPKSLTVGDFFPNPATNRVSTPKPLLKWPNAPTLKDDIFKDLCKKFNPLSFHNLSKDLYEPLMNPTKPAQSSSSKKTFKCTKNLKNNLTNLDLIDPCTPQNPCILDRMCEYDNDKLNLVTCWQRSFY